MPRRRRIRALALFAALATIPGARSGAAASAPSAEQALCLGAIQAAEKSSHLPPKLLDAIGLVESGRPDSQSGRVAPWPWTINVAGVGHFYNSKADAIAAVEEAQAAGMQSIDVGCMQVNLMYHPAAFASLQQAFDPRTNAIYAASFLTALFEQTRDWGIATGAYHSQTPDLSHVYRKRVAAWWPDASRYGMAPRDGATLPASRLQIDPHGIYTPEFRARLARAAADRATRIAMGLVPTPPRVTTARRGPAALHASLTR